MGGWGGGGEEEKGAEMDSNHVHQTRVLPSLSPHLFEVNGKQHILCGDVRVQCLTLDLFVKGECNPQVVTIVSKGNSWRGGVQVLRGGRGRGRERVRERERVRWQEVRVGTGTFRIDMSCDLSSIHSPGDR